MNSRRERKGEAEGLLGIGASPTVRTQAPGLQTIALEGRNAHLSDHICPICGSEVIPEQVRIDSQSFALLQKLNAEGILQAFLQIARVHIYDIMKIGAPGAAGLTKAVSTLQEEVRSATSQGLEGLGAEVTAKFQQVLVDMGFPEPQQMQLLAQFVPNAVDLMRRLIELQTVPTEKGREGERLLLDQLTSYFPDDEITPLGKSGETDIIAKPSHEGQKIGVEVLVESKRNSQSGWRRTYIDEVRRHMSDHNTKYAILAVDAMPRGANGYLTEYHPEGVIFVTSQDTCHVAYGAIRAVLIATGRLARRTVDLTTALSDKRVSDRIQSLYSFEEFHRHIRKNATSVVTAGRKIAQDVDEATEFLRESLGELQKVVQEVVSDTELSSPSGAL